MRGETKLVSLLATLSVILVCSAAFASGVLDVSKIPLFYTPDAPFEPDQAAGGTVLVDPGTLIVDYVPGYQIGDVFSLSVNVTGVTTGIYTYAVNVTWNPSVLNFSGLVSYGDFLLQTTTPVSGKTSRITLPETAPVSVNYAVGTASIAETVLGKGPYGVTGQGRLFTVNFEVVGYGYSNIVIEDGTGSRLPTELLDATEPEPVNLPFEAEDGYFRNGLFGDANLDKTVNVFDILAVKSRWGRTPVSPDWIREYDVNDDAAVNVFDILTVKANWGRTVP